MEKPSKEDMTALIEYWRSMIPKRPLTSGQNTRYSREQAHHLRAFADEGKPAVDVQWLFEQTAIPVKLVPSHVLSENSGLTTDEPDGTLRIFINENEPYVRQRFSILHELKHVLDYYDHPILYQKLGRGDEESWNQAVEALCNDFAAHVLMPTELVRRVWLATNDIASAASTFNVSYDAMRTRLEILGFIKNRRFWRSTRLTYAADPCLEACTV